jgi:hypothetical protein
MREATSPEAELSLRISSSSWQATRPARKYQSILASSEASRVSKGWYRPSLIAAPIEASVARWRAVHSSTL